MSDSSEDDFMSDKFLTEAAPQPSSSTTYAERRRRAAAASQAKVEAHRIKPSLLREKEAREEGLRTNLIEKELAKERDGGEVGVGLKMMLKMGFDAGKGLGKEQDAPPKESAPAPEDAEGESEEEGARGGLGSSKRRRLEEPMAAGDHQTAAQSASSSTLRSEGGQLLEPLSISIWAGRRGIGGTSKASAAPALPPPTTIAPFDASQYRSRGSAEYAERKSEGQLRSAQKTVLSLDARDDKGFSILHLVPSDPTTFPPPLLEALSLLPPMPVIQSYSAEENQSQAALLKAQMAADTLVPLAGSGLEDEDEEVGGQMGLGALQKGREEARDRARTTESSAPAPAAEDEGSSDSEDWTLLAAEARKLLMLPASQRLPLTLQYLREEYNYCFFCGFAYGDHEALERDCPGELEDDHD